MALEESRTSAASVTTQVRYSAHTTDGVPVSWAGPLIFDASIESMGMRVVGQDVTFRGAIAGLDASVSTIFTAVVGDSGQVIITSFDSEDDRLSEPALDRAGALDSLVGFILSGYNEALKTLRFVPGPCPNCSGVKCIECVRGVSDHKHRASCPLCAPDDSVNTTVLIESPYAGDVHRNLTYLRRAIADCLRRGESPYASHMTLTQVLDDLDPQQREQGLNAGWAFIPVVGKVVVYTDYGISAGMERGIERARASNVVVEYRAIGVNDATIEREVVRLTR